MIQGDRNVDFGFGRMRLPVLRADEPDSFDYGRIEQLFDAFLVQGFPYFDTADTYHGYHTEEAVRGAQAPLRGWRRDADAGSVPHEKARSILATKDLAIS